MKMRLCFLAAALAGCAPPGPVAVHPTAGTVTYDGKPAAGVRVFLVPTSAPSVPLVPQNPSAVTDAAGRFALTTYREGDGAAEGGYQVVLLWPQGKAEEEEEGSTGDCLLGWYDAARTKLTAQIKAGSNELPPIKLPAVNGPPGKMKGIPGKN
ncbi:MAG: hypothetical protein ACRC33_14035 [Gemmataceae bacterium]